MISRLVKSRRELDRCVVTSDFGMQTRSRCLVAVLVLLAACGRTTVTMSPATSSSDPATTVPATTAVARAVSSGSPEGAVTVIDGFGLDLARRGLGLDKGNSAISPLSIATALTMTSAGARGDTAAEMNRVLGIADPATIHESMNTFDQSLAANQVVPKTDDERSIELATANRAFVQNDLKVEQPFLNTLASQYASDVGPVNFKGDQEAARTTINGWVSDRTKAHIPELIAKGVITQDTRLALVNALYLKANWAVPFESAVPGTFNTPTGAVQVPMMGDINRGQIAAGDGWRAVDLPYVGDQLSMTIVLPDEGKFDAVVAQLDATHIAAMRSAKEGPRAVVKMPKFDMSRNIVLDDQLKAMGMNVAFSGAADFSGMTTKESLQIQTVIHQATVTVDENGTVATAATAVLIFPVSMPQTTPFVVDRPFLFFISDHATNAVLFVGQVIDPTKP
jgi:serpin B